MKILKTIQEDSKKDNEKSETFKPIGRWSTRELFY